MATTVDSRGQLDRRPLLSFRVERRLVPSRVENETYPRGTSIDIEQGLNEGSTDGSIHRGETR